MIINATNEKPGGITMPVLPSYVDGRVWLCTSPELLGRSIAPVGAALAGELRHEVVAAHAVRTAMTDVFVPITGIPAWSPPI